GLTIRNAAKSGINIDPAGVQLRRLKVYGNGSSGPSNFALDHGLYWSSPGGSRDAIPDCLFYANAAEGMQFYGSAIVGQCVMSGCTADHNGRDGFLLEAGATSPTTQNVTVRNCIATSNGRFGF